MADLTCTCGCAEGLMVSSIPDDCNSIDFGYPYLIAIQNKDANNVTNNSFAGASPTVGELEALALLTNQLHVSFIGPFTNGQKTEKSRETQSGADTIDGLENVISQTIAITGKLKYLDETVICDLADLNCYTRVRIWYITSKGYIFGGTTGFIVPNFFSEWLHEGFGNVSHVPIAFEYKVDRTHTYCATNQDDDYLTLSN